MGSMHSAKLMLTGCLLNRILVYFRLRGLWYTEVYNSQYSMFNVHSVCGWDDTMTKSSLGEDRVCSAHFSRSQSTVGDIHTGPLATAVEKPWRTGDCWLALCLTPTSTVAQCCLLRPGPLCIKTMPHRRVPPDLGNFSI